MKNDDFPFGRYIKIVIILAISYSFVTYLSPQIFLGNSNRINPNFIAKLKKVPGNLIAFLQKSLSNNSNITINNNRINQQNQVIFSQLPQITPPSKLIYQTVSKGIKLGMDPLTKKSYAVFDQNIKFKTVDMEINGKKLKGIVPQ